MLLVIGKETKLVWSAYKIHNLPTLVPMSALKNVVLFTVSN